MTGPNPEGPSGDATERHAEATVGEPDAPHLAHLFWEGGTITLRLRPGQTLVIGRDESADVQVPTRTLSRRHARLTVGERITVEDLDSSNGTRIGSRALEPGAPVAIAYGDIVEMGAARLVLSQAAPSIVPPGDLPPEQEGSTWRVRGPRLLETLAASELSVLILGETGTGKELAARRVHTLSSRAQAPFLGINCASLPDSLLESELFGFEKGAFTGALKAKPGLFEAASGGTVFLDEIGEMPLALQAKLLRVLESREVLPLGASKPRPIDFRLVSATHRDLRADIAAGRFRQDLYYRVNGASVTIPPLRERRDEILPLARTFLADVPLPPGRARPRLAPASETALVDYAWPGNVRELRNVIERAAVLCTAEAIAPGDLQLEDAPVSSTLASGSGSESGQPLAAGERSERDRIVEALAQSAGNQRRAAEILGISLRTLINRLERYGLPRPRKPANKT